jgi:hypothetical protein
MLLLGGFAIAAAFTKRNIARRAASWVLSRVSSRPKCAPCWVPSRHTEAALSAPGSVKLLTLAARLGFLQICSCPWLRDKATTHLPSHTCQEALRLFDAVLCPAARHLSCAVD